MKQQMKVLEKNLSVGKRLEQARNNKMLKQVSVMKLTGINNKTLSGYESGKSNPDYQTLKILSSLYGVSVQHLITGDEQQETAQPTETTNPELDKLRTENSQLQEQVQHLKSAIHHLTHGLLMDKL